MPAMRKPSMTKEQRPRPTTAELRLADENYERSHGKIIRNRGLAREGMRLVLAVYQGKMTFEEYERHWEKLCASYR